MKLLNPVKTKVTNSVLASDDVVCKAGQFTEIGRYKGQISEVVALGYGPYDKLNEAVGRAVIDLQKTGGGNIDGLIRIERRDPQDNFVDKVIEDRTESFRGSSTPSEQLPFPIRKAGVGRDSYFVFTFCPDVDTTVDVSTCKVNLDATRFKALYNY